jgi:hypothetical protein
MTAPISLAQQLADRLEYCDRHSMMLRHDDAQEIMCFLRSLATPPSEPEHAGQTYEQLRRERNELRFRIQSGTCCDWKATADHWLQRTHELSAEVELTESIRKTESAHQSALEQQLAEETGIVDRVWDQLGRRTYEQLAGRSIHDLIEELKQQLAAAQAQHNELLYAVARKWPNESRHETALRYIREAESHEVAGSAAKSAEESGSGDNGAS